MAARGCVARTGDASWRRLVPFRHPRRMLSMRRVTPNRTASESIAGPWIRSSSASGPLSAAGAPAQEPATAPAAMPSAVAAARDGLLGSTNSGTTGGGTAQSGASAPDVSGPLIVRTGQLDLQVADLEAAIRDAESAVTAVGGYVAGSQRSGDVPAD